MEGREKEKKEGEKGVSVEGREEFEAKDSYAVSTGTLEGHKLIEGAGSWVNMWVNKEEVVVLGK